ncbi:MAG: tape measure protein [Cyanobacteriota bacterium]
MTSIGELSVDLKLDTSQLDREIAGLGSRYSKNSLPIKAHLQESEFKKQLDTLKRQKLSLKVQLEPDTADFLRKVKAINVPPISVKLSPDLEGLQKQLNKVSVVAGIDSEKFAQHLENAVFQGMKRSQKKGLFSTLSSIILSPLALLGSTLSGVMGGVVAGVGISLGKGITDATVKAVESAFNRVEQKFDERVKQQAQKTGSQVETVKNSTATTSRASVQQKAQQSSQSTTTSSTASTSAIPTDVKSFTELVQRQKQSSSTKTTQSENVRLDSNVLKTSTERLAREIVKESAALRPTPALTEAKAGLSEAEVLKQATVNQAAIKQNLSGAFKGKGKAKKIASEDAANAAIESINQQIKFLSEELKRTDLSSKTRQKLGQLLGAASKQQEAYLLVTVDRKSQRMQEAHRQSLQNSEVIDKSAVPQSAASGVKSKSAAIVRAGNNGTKILGGLGAVGTAASIFGGGSAQAATVGAASSASAGAGLLGLLASPVGLAGLGVAGLGLGLVGARASKKVLGDKLPVLYKPLDQLGGEIATGLADQVSQMQQSVRGKLSGNLLGVSNFLEQKFNFKPIVSPRLSLPKPGELAKSYLNEVLAVQKQIQQGESSLVVTKQAISGKYNQIAELEKTRQNLLEKEAAELSKLNQKTEANRQFIQQYQSADDSTKAQLLNENKSPVAQFIKETGQIPDPEVKTSKVLELARQKITQIDGAISDLQQGVAPIEQGYKVSKLEIAKLQKQVDPKKVDKRVDEIRGVEKVNQAADLVRQLGSRKNLSDTDKTRLEAASKIVDRYLAENKINTSDIAASAKNGRQALVMIATRVKQVTFSELKLLSENFSPDEYRENLKQAFNTADKLQGLLSKGSFKDASEYKAHAQKVKETRESLIKILQEQGLDVTEMLKSVPKGEQNSFLSATAYTLSKSGNEKLQQELGQKITEPAIPLGSQLKDRLDGFINQYIKQNPLVKMFAKGRNFDPNASSKKIDKEQEEAIKKRAKLLAKQLDNITEQTEKQIAFLEGNRKNLEAKYVGGIKAKKLSNFATDIAKSNKSLSDEQAKVILSAIEKAKPFLSSMGVNAEALLVGVTDLRQQMVLIDNAVEKNVEFATKSLKNAPRVNEEQKKAVQKRAADLKKLASTLTNYAGKEELTQEERTLLTLGSNQATRELKGAKLKPDDRLKLSSDGGFGVRFIPKKSDIENGLRSAATKFPRLKNSAGFLEMEAALLDLPNKVGRAYESALSKIEDRKLRRTVRGLVEALREGFQLPKLKIENFDIVRSRINGLLMGISKPIRDLGVKIFDLVKGFLALRTLTSLQGILDRLASGSFEVAVKLEALQKRLEFVSGGAAKAAGNFNFIKGEAKRLNTPLVEAAEGFTSFSAAVKGTSLERQSKEIFGAVSQSIAVMGLGIEDSKNVYVALQQMAGKGKISAEEWRQQLSEKLPMATAVATRALGVTSEEFSRMLDNGQLLSQDFLPRFAAQLASETAGGVAGAANTGQAALNRFNNSLVGLQVAVGQTALPFQKLGLNAASGVLEGLSDNGVTLTQIILALSGTLTLNLIGPILKIPIVAGLAKMAIGGMSATLGWLSKSLKTVALQFAVFYGAMELFNLSGRLINGGELSKDFKQMENAAKEAAKGISGVKTAADDLKGGDSPDASNWSDSAILGLRSIDPTGISKNIVTFSELDRDRAIESIYESRGAIFEALLEVRKQVKLAEKGSSPLNLLEGVDGELERVSQNRKILQAQIKREFTDLGKAVPPELKNQLLELNTQFGALSQQRTDIAKPFTEKLTQFQKAADEAKAKLDFLNTPQGAADFRGTDNELEGAKQEATLLYNQAREGQLALEKLLQTTKADPVLALRDAFRLLNIELAKNAEKAQFATAARQEGIVQNQIVGFSKDYFAPQRAALANAQAERDRVEREMANLQSSIESRRNTLGQGANVPVLAELGVTAETSAAEIQSIMDRLPDGEEAKKKILENMKLIKEDELKLAQTRVQAATSELQERQQVEAATLAVMQKAVSDRESLLKREESGAVIAVRRKQQALMLTEEQASEEIAKISLRSTERQIGNIFEQRKAFYDLFAQGKISAQQFHDKDRELTNQLSDLKKQAVEQELQLRQQANQRILKDLEFANSQAAGVLQRLQQNASVTVKEKQLDGNLNETQAASQLEGIQMDAAYQEINLNKQKLADLDTLERQGVKTAREVATEKLQIQQQIAGQYLQILDQQLAREKRLRDEANAEAESQIASNNQQAIRAAKETQLGGGKSERETAAALEAITSSTLEAEIALTQEKLQQNISTQERRQLEGQLEQQMTQAVDGRLAANKRIREEALADAEDRVRAASRITEEQVRQNDLQSKQNDLLIKSDEQLKTVLESRQNLSKALSDAKIASLEAPLEQLKKAEDLFGRLLSEEGLLNNAGKSLASKATANLRDVMVSQIRAAGVAINPDQLRSLVAQSKESTPSGETARAKLAEIELAILNNRFALENQLAEAKKQAQEAERQHNEVMMQFDLKRTEMQARQAVYAARKEEIEARGAMLAAKLEEEKARRLEDPREKARAIADAQSKGRLARDGFNNAQDNLSLAQNNLNSQSELAANARRTMEATQMSQRSQEASADAARNNAQQLERAEKASKRLAENAAAGAGAMGGGGGYTLRVGSQEWEQQRQARTAFSNSINAPGDQKSNLIQAAMSMKDNPFFAMMLQNNGMGDMAQLAGQLKNANPMSVAGAMARAQTGNKDVVEELRKLNDNISGMASRPTNLNVSTASPVRDAASIYGDLSKQSVRGANL